jgi:hypothetical protein
LGKPSNFPSAAARHVYLNALQSEWPEVLGSLHEDVFPRLVELWSERLVDSSELFSKKLKQFEDALADKKLDKALRSWAMAFSVKDDWMLENARTTMYMYGANWKDPTEEWPTWIQQGPNHLMERQTFEMAFNGWWIPTENGGLQTWDEFAGNFRTELNKGLNAYRKSQSARFGVLKENAGRDARWTVRYQKGTLAVEIAKELPSAYGDPEQTVWKAIDRFAKEINLTLRQNRRRTQK